MRKGFENGRSLAWHARGCEFESRPVHDLFRKKVIW